MRGFGVSPRKKKKKEVALITFSEIKEELPTPYS
jgi:hypothetical protein